MASSMIDTIDDLIEVLNEEYPNWQDDWDNNPIDAGLGECVIDHIEAHFLEEGGLDFSTGRCPPRCARRCKHGPCPSK